MLDLFALHKRSLLHVLPQRATAEAVNILAGPIKYGMRDFELSL